MKTLNVQLYRSNYLWFEVFNTNQSEVLNEENELAQPVATFTSNFDYEILPRNTWRIYVDIGIEMIPAASILVRSAFVFNNKGLSWDDLFTMQHIVPIVHKSIWNTILGFKEQCLAFKITMPGDLKEDDEIAFAISKNIIDQYYASRKPAELANNWLLNNPGLECHTNDETMITLKGTFAILDEVLYKNNKFDRAQNLDVFRNIVPEGKYFTLKINCIAIDEHLVRLSLYNSALFYQCLGCALQLLSGDKADLLLPALESNGMTKEVRDIFAVSGTEILHQLRELLESANAHLLNRNEEHDWNKIIEVMEINASCDAK